jgi:hypothetical protein
MPTCALPSVTMARPSAAVLDNQSVKSVEKMGGHDRGASYDAGKKVEGRKTHALVDTEGLPLRIIVYFVGNLLVRPRRPARRGFQRAWPTHSWLSLRKHSTCHQTAGKNVGFCVRL